MSASDADGLVPRFSGRCLCGAVRYRVEAAPLWMGHCHCESCRRATSSGFASFIGVARGAIVWTGAAPTVFASSPGVTRSFCGTCGSPIAFESALWPEETHLYAGTLDEPERFAPQFHVHSEEAVAWSIRDDGLPRHAGMLPDEAGA